MYKTTNPTLTAPGQSILGTIVSAWRAWSAQPCSAFSHLLNAPLTWGMTLGALFGSALLSVAIALPLLGVDGTAGWSVALILAAALLVRPGMKRFIEEGEE